MESIVVTASAGAFPGLAETLRHASLTVQERPLVSFVPPADWSQLDAALAHRSRYGSLALTSPRAAAAVVDRVRACGVTWSEGNSPAVWAVGAATVAALGGTLGAIQVPGEPPDSDPSAAGRLARAMVEAKAVGPVLFACGERRREELPTILRAQGIKVEEVVCYRAVLATPDDARAAVAGSTILVVASPSVVELLAQSCPPPARPALVAIGATTAASARAVGWPPAAVAGAPSTAALASAIAGILNPRQR